MRMLIAYPYAAAWSWPPAIEAVTCGHAVEAIEAAVTEDTTVLVTDAMPKNLERCGGLNWIHLLSAGYNQAIGHPLAARKGVRVSNSAGICAGHMAEFAVGQMLRHVKRFDEMDGLQRARTWPNRSALATPALRGRRALIVGYGGVGRETARLLRALGVDIDVVQRTTEIETYPGYLPYPGMGDPAGELPQRRFTLETMSEALGEADFVILTIPLTAQTKHLINRESLAAMKRGAVLINLARGALVETSALEAAIATGHLAHAYLDVFVHEPLPGDDPVWALPGITVTPHMSGVMPDAARLHEDLVKQNLGRFQARDPLLNEINPARLTA